MANNKTNQLVLPGFIGLVMVLILSGCNRTSLSVGAAQAPVNPPMGSFIAGDRQDRHFNAVLDSLWAKAVVVSDGKEKLAIVTIDCIGLLKPEIDRIREQVARRTDIKADHIVVSSTHTHSGPDVVGIWGKDYTSSGVDPAYLSFLVTTASEQIILADRTRTSVTAVAGSGTFDGKWFSNISDEELDRTVSVLQFRDGTGKSVATLTNFACHPTFLDGTFTIVSSDYPGTFYGDMNQEIGGINLFLQGAIGGWVQPNDELRGQQGAQAAGKSLADFTRQILSTAKQIQVDKGIKFLSATVRLPVENKNWIMLSQVGTIKRQFTDSVSTDMAWFSIGDAHFATHPGETSPWLGLETRKLMPEGTRFVLGLSQDALGYILKPDFFTDTTYQHSGYLTSMSLGPQTTPVLLQQLHRFAGK